MDPFKHVELALERIPWPVPLLMIAAGLTIIACGYRGHAAFRPVLVPQHVEYGGERYVCISESGGGLWCEREVGGH